MTPGVEIIRPAHVRNQWHHVAGLGILALNSLRHRLQGYRTPRPRSMSQADDALAYDHSVLENWRTHLRDYLQRDIDVEGREVLEMGPGPDLGTGLLWLAEGASGYTAVDAHALTGRGTEPLHRALAQRIAAAREDNDLERYLLDAIARMHKGEDGPLRYRVISNYDLSALAPLRFDLVVSHSSWEHVTHIDRALERLDPLVTSRAHLVTEIDLQTHTRWIRDVDPLNIYRYDRRTYRTFSFNGIPNRERPDHYLELLEKFGWRDLRVYPRRVLEQGYVEKIEPSLCPTFRGDREHLSWLSVVICASRPGERSWRPPHA